MPTGVYERTPEHLATLARNRGKRKRKANGLVDSVTAGPPPPEPRASAVILSFATDQLVEAARDGDMDLARQWLTIGDAIKDGCFD